MSSQDRAEQCEEWCDDFCGWVSEKKLAGEYRGLAPLRNYLGGRAPADFLNRKRGYAYEDGRRRAEERRRESPDNRVRRGEGFYDVENGEDVIAAPNTNRGFDEVDARLDRDAPLGDRPRERLKKRARNRESRILSVLFSKIDPNAGKRRNNNDNNR